MYFQTNNDTRDTYYIVHKQKKYMCGLDYDATIELAKSVTSKKRKEDHDAKG